MISHVIEVFLNDIFIIGFIYIVIMFGSDDVYLVNLIILIGMKSRSC